MYLAIKQVLPLAAMLLPTLAIAAPAAGGDQRTCQAAAQVTSSSSTDIISATSAATAPTSTAKAMGASANTSLPEPPSVPGKVVGAWIAPWDDWTNANLQGVTDLFVGFVDISSSTFDSLGNVNPKVDFTGWESGKFQPSNEKIENLKQANPTIKRTWAAFGGWGVERTFQNHSKTDELRKGFATGVADFMKKNPVFDGIDIDWEFPVDGGEFYRIVPPNDDEIETFPLLLEAIKSANPEKYVAIDVPGRPTDMKNAKYNFAKIMENVSLVNVMAYDMCNRRDSVFSHHASEAGAETAAEAYIASGVPRDKITVGFPMFGKAFKTISSCPTGGPASLVGSELAEMEYKGNGSAVLGASAQIRYLESGNTDPNAIPQWYTDFSAAFKDDISTYDEVAMANAKCVNGFIYSWQGAQAMKASSRKLMAKGYKGGFAYAYGQDTTDQPRWKAYIDGMTGSDSA